MEINCIFNTVLESNAKIAFFHCKQRKISYLCAIFVKIVLEQ